MLNRFKTKKVKTTITVGECLKRKREELEISIKDLSNKLGIKADYLENLEQNNYDKLPPDVYVKGFIKNYSELIGFNPEKMVDLFKKEKEIDDKIENRNKIKKKIEKKFTIKKYVFITPKITAIFLSLLVLSVIGYYFWYQLSSFNSAPYLFVSSPFADEITNDSEIVVSGETEIGMTIKINGEDIPVSEDGYFEEKVMLQSGKNVIIIEAINRFDKIAKEIRNIIYERKLKPMPIDNP